MQTYSHFLMTAVVNRFLKQQTDIPVHSTMFLAGSFAPDVALGVLSAGFVIDRRMKKLDHSWCGDEFNQTFFSDPRWIISHNLLHAPFVLLLLMVVGAYVNCVHKRSWGQGLLWFATGCLFHTSVDFLTHYDDGPLVFFPFDWKTRTRSIVSYWDVRHGAKLFSLFEHLFDVAFAVYTFAGVLKACSRTNDELAIRPISLASLK